MLALLLLGTGFALLTARASSVVVRWETASEVGTASFNVYRLEADDPLPGREWARVNEALIPAQGEPSLGALYWFEDDDPMIGVRHMYRIEEVQWDGAVNRFPDEIAVRTGVRRRWVRTQGLALIGLGLLLMRWPLDS